MQHSIHLIGLNHRTATVEVRERFALASFCEAENWAVPLGNGIKESLILSTCNRVEVVVVGEDATVREQALSCWSQACGREPSELEPYIYYYQGQEAIQHLFSVASSLDSLVLGEPQILGQLKVAYRKALETNHAGLILNRLLHKAFSVAKRVRTETGVASSAVSISYAAVELAKRIFDDMGKHEALLIGAGEMAELAAMHLVQAGVKRIRVANRTMANAQELAERVGGEAIPFERLFDYLADADIIISSTGAPDAIIRAKDMRDILRRRKQRPMFLIDIAMPRDIDPDVNTLDNIYLYDIDDLKEVVEENLAQRRDEAEKARSIVHEETAGFGAWMQSLELHPTIVALVQRGESIMEEELARTFRRLGTLDDDTKQALQIMAQSIVRRFNHEPIQYLKKEHGLDVQNSRMHNIDIIQRVFQLNSSDK